MVARLIAGSEKSWHKFSRIAEFLNYGEVLPTTKRQDHLLRVTLRQAPLNDLSVISHLRVSILYWPCTTRKPKAQTLLEPHRNHEVRPLYHFSLPVRSLTVLGSKHAISAPARSTHPKESPSSATTPNSSVSAGPNATRTSK